jgi:glutathione S-transferase
VTKPNLISFDLCPFVQRSVITLLEKKIDFDITYIDLAEPPEWFLGISPLGKVPALRIGDTTLFESAVINEYLDEITPPSLHPGDPLEKATNRAWIEFASELLFDQYHLCIAATEEDLTTHHKTIKNKLLQLEGILTKNTFFNGENFCLIDAAFAPAFMRFDILENQYPLDVYTNHPKVSLWADNLRQKESVQQSVISNFSEKYLEYIRNTNGYAAQIFS